MANGDIAAAAGLPVVTPTADVRLGYDEINRTRDQVAVHMTTGTDTWDNVTGKPTTFPPAAHDHGNTVVKSYIGQDVRLRQDGAGRDPGRAGRSTGGSRGVATQAAVGTDKELYDAPPMSGNISRSFRSDRSASSLSRTMPGLPSSYST